MLAPATIATRRPPGPPMPPAPRVDAQDAVWNDLREACGANAFAGPDRFAVLGTRGRASVQVSRWSAQGTTWVVAAARVAPAHAARAEDMLRHNAALAVGAMCIEDGQLIIRHAAPLAGVDVAHTVRAVALLGKEAARLAAALGTTSGTNLFSNFAD